jgi:Concanavalin A-like lectin/glucanases superfamily
MEERARSTGKPAIPQSQPEVYAKEAIYLHDAPRRELKLQAIRIGRLGITAIPNEVFAITGLKIKQQSPFDTTMNIELANGSEGYIPPPEQHRLGGYTTWPARTAGLEVQAEPRIVARVLKLLEQVAEKPRRSAAQGRSPYAEAILAARPIAYWRLDDIDAAGALDSSDRGLHASFDGGVALYLPGAPLAGPSNARSMNRAVHLAGGRLSAAIEIPGDHYTATLWFWNGLATGVRPITGWLLCFGGKEANHETGAGFDLGLGGTDLAEGRLFVSTGSAKATGLSGKTKLEPRTWHHVALVREGREVLVYLDGNPRPEIAGEAGAEVIKGVAVMHVGGCAGSLASFEGKIDEVAVFDRALSSNEVTAHFQASRGPGGADRSKAP